MSVKTVLLSDFEMFFLVKLRAPSIGGVAPRRLRRGLFELNL